MSVGALVKVDIISIRFKLVLITDISRKEVMHYDQELHKHELSKMFDNCPEGSSVVGHGMSSEVVSPLKLQEHNLIPILEG
jgi:hypothetical protein